MAHLIHTRDDLPNQNPNKKRHHNLFFDEDLEQHAQEIYNTPQVSNCQKSVRYQIYYQITHHQICCMKMVIELSFKLNFFLKKIPSGLRDLYSMSVSRASRIPHAHLRCNFLYLLCSPLPLRTLFYPFMSVSKASLTPHAHLR